MKRQVLIIHGGDTFSSYEDYLDFLNSYAIDESDIEKMKEKGWKDLLQEYLGNDFDVISPKMPCKWNAKYDEWKIWIEKFIPYLGEGVILIGHSLGGVFLVRYLSESSFPINISQLHLVAAPFGDNNDESGDTEKYNLCDFNIKDDLSLLEKSADKIFLYHSEDDPTVPFRDLEKYSKKIPKAKKIVFEDRGHFNQAEFPELVKNLKENL